MEPVVAAIVTLVVTLGAMIFWWGVSLGTKDASVADRWWAMGGLLACLVAWQLAGATGPRFYVLFIVAAWAIRLSGHIYGRSQGQPEDPRYAAWRREHGHSWWWRSLLQVFLAQGVLLWVTVAPALVVLLVPEGPGFGPLDVFGIIVATTGIVFSGVADTQLQLWRNNPDHRGSVFDKGLWRYSRHPNYFGEALTWWGIWMVAAAHGAWWTLGSPILLTVLLVQFSGVKALEGHLLATKPEYAGYVSRTSPFLPMPPRD